MLNNPEFEITSKNFHQTGQEYTPIWFRVDPVTFVFANYGGKSGTILDIKLNFASNTKWKDFLDNFDFSFGHPTKDFSFEYPSLPITID